MTIDTGHGGHVIAVTEEATSHLRLQNKLVVGSIVSDRVPSSADESSSGKAVGIVVDRTVPDHVIVSTSTCSLVSDYIWSG